MATETVRRLRFRQYFGGSGEIAGEFTQIQLAAYATPKTWHPAINAYRCEKGFAICVELAGVDKEQMEVRVESQRVVLRGQRQAPEPVDTGQRAVQVLLMEIDYGPFERVVTLPDTVDPERVTAQQRSGFLWIHLPLRSL